VRDALRAVAGGIWSTVRAPGLLVTVVLATLAAAIPFGVVVGRDVQSALANQPPIDLSSEEIDADWWAEYRAQAQGLQATFTPAIIGFAAPLDNLSALLDREPRPAVLLVPVLIYVAVLALLWGGLIDRFWRGDGSVRRFVDSARHHFPQMFVVSVVAAVAAVLLYGTVHAVLFGPVFSALSKATSSERDAFFLRVVLYAIFAALLAIVSVLADYARINIVVRQGSVRASLLAAVAFLRTRPTAVISLWLLCALLFVMLLTLYGMADRRLEGWRLIAVGQAYIFGRLAIRVINTASQVRLFELHR
jgi:hypothetical protein